MLHWHIKTFSALSLNAVKLVLKELAAFHASGYHFIHSYPGGLEALAKEYPSTFKETFFGVELEEDVAKNMLDIIANMFGSCVVVTMKYGSAEVAEKMTAYLPKVKHVMENYFSSKWRLRNLNHGDAWYNNFLYRCI